MARRASFGGYEQERFQSEVDSRLECSICQEVLKDPVQCRNEHYFCRSCIRKSLCENAESCPICAQHLTEETLTKPPRILTDMLQSLMIRCDHASRGCRESIKLEFLERHVERCEYSPNAGCAEVVNRHEKERHERELCQFRTIVCGECGERVMWKSSRVHPCFMRKEIDELAKNMREIKHEVKLTQEEMTYLTKEATERFDLFTGRQNILVCGGHDGKNVLNSVESYNWPENSWTLEPAMKEAREAPSAFVHEREIYVSGGWNGTRKTDSIESTKVDKIEWIKSPVKMPIKCNGHTMISLENSAVLTGGRDNNDHVSDAIYDIELNPPYGTKLLTHMPEPGYLHGCQIIDNQVVVAGGRTSRYGKDTKNTVYVFDINNNEWKTLPQLPFAVSNMAIVSYKGNVILIGGVNEKVQTLNSVVMYDVKTGKVKLLPCLNHKRSGSSAVITGNVIAVMGGYVYETKERLNSVECLDLSTGNVWRELSPMTTKRSNATAVLKPMS